ncbi:MAG: hypothetical protein IPO92_23100 [Saprospiraceae bacterium]|nr:hypothetical protein [Saprospiraceae bacterium]
MTDYREFRVGGGNSPFGFFGPLVILAVFFAALFFLAKGVFWLFSWIAPVLLIATLIMDYTIVTDFFKFIWKLLKENTIMGILAMVLTFFGYPFVAGFLFFKALSKRTIKKVIEKAEKERDNYAEYEEVVEEENFLELPQLNKTPKQTVQQPSKSSEYDDMFK